MPATTQTRMIAVDKIVGQIEIGRRFDASPQAVWNWTQRPDFPKPIGQASGRPIYDLDEVVDWDKNWVRSKGGYHTHKTRQNGQAPKRRSRRQWKEGDPE